MESGRNSFKWVNDRALKYGIVSRFLINDHELSDLHNLCISLSKNNGKLNATLRDDFFAMKLAKGVGLFLS